MTPKTRIETRFQQLAAAEKTGFVAYICAGDPSLEATEDIVYRLEDAGADVIELGVPFSDPVADGPSIQRAAERSLAAGTRFHQILEMIGRIRTKSEVPLLLFSYLNPLVARPFTETVSLAKSAGVDGFLMVDLSVEEADPYKAEVHEQGLNIVNLITPTSSNERIQRIANASSGFVYCVSRLGVTGEQSELQNEAQGLLDRAHQQTDLPIALGFGVSTPEQARSYAAMTEAVVVGSYIVNSYHEHSAADATAKVKQLIDAVKEV